MADIKDKVITAESLKALHEYNQKMYVPMTDPEIMGDLSVGGDVYANGDKLVKSTDIIPMTNGGTNASDGATGLANLFASGNTVLSSYQYGDELPEAGTKGRIFFKRLTDV